MFTHITVVVFMCVVHKLTLMYGIIYVYICVYKVIMWIIFSWSIIKCFVYVVAFYLLFTVCYLIIVME